MQLNSHSISVLPDVYWICYYVSNRVMAN